MTLQASPFYMHSENKGRLGKYFGAQRKDRLTVASTQSDPDAADFSAESIVHNPTNASSIDAILKIRPRQEAWGALFGFYYDMEKLSDGLWLKIIVPVVEVDNNLGLTATGQTKEGDFELLDYFKGKISQTADDRIQDALKFGIINGSDSTTQVADILLTLGYNFFEGEDHYVGFSAGLTIPTGTKPKNLKLFEASVGNGNFFGIHVGAEGSLNLWRKNNTLVEISARLLFTGLFNDTHKRIVGLKSQDGRKIVWGHYRLGGELGKRGVFPLANVLRQKVSVDPGNQFEALTMISLQTGSFTGNIGVNLYAHEAERITLRDEEFTPDIFGLTLDNYDTNATFILANVPVDETFITREMLDKQAAETPAQVSTKIFGTFSYTGSDERYPVLVGVGTGYEFVGNNTLAESWSLWGTLGISF